METKHISELKPAAYNPRILDKHDGEALDRSIKRWGDISGITFNVQSGNLITGHQRISILRKSFGDELVKVEITERYEQPDEHNTVATGNVIVVGKNIKLNYREVSVDLNEEKAMNIGANRIEATWNQDLLAQINYELSQLENGQELLALTGQTEDEINKLLDMVGANGEGNPEDDEAPEVDDVNPPVSKLGEIYQLGAHRLMCGDATDFGAVSDLMDGKQADMVFTDPPYNTGMTGETQGADTLWRGNGKNNGSTRSSHMFNDSYTPAEWESFMESFITNYEAVMKDNSIAYICLDWRRNFELIPHIKKCFKLSNVIVWDKVIHGLGSDYKYTYEVINVCKKGNPQLDTHQGEDAEYSDVWHIMRKMGRDEEHATKKPIELVTRALRHGSKRGDIIVDLFGGSGSTLVACEDFGRICYMSELDPKYCDVIRKRFATHTNQEDWVLATPVIQSAEEAPVAIEQPVA